MWKHAQSNYENLEEMVFHFKNSTIYSLIIFIYF